MGFGDVWLLQQRFLQEGLRAPASPQGKLHVASDVAWLSEPWCCILHGRC